jgi:hypothetical protein
MHPTGTWTLAVRPVRFALRYSELILGNVRDQPLAEAWTGERLAGLRRIWRTRNQVPVICQSCRHYLY